MYVSRTESSCTSPQCGHLTFSVANPSGLKALHIGLDADAGGRLLVFGQK